MKKRILILIETSRIYGRQIIDGIVRYSLENDNWILFVFIRQPLLKQTIQNNPILANCPTSC